MSSNIEQLKLALDVETSEELFGIEQQPVQQCPVIDKLIGVLCKTEKDIVSWTKDLSRIDTIEEAQAIAKDIDWCSNEINQANELEKLRRQIDKLRLWGQGWKDLAKDLMRDFNDEKLIDFASSQMQIKYQIRHV